MGCRCQERKEALRQWMGGADLDWEPFRLRLPCWLRRVAQRMSRDTMATSSPPSATPTANH